MSTDIAEIFAIDDEISNEIIELNNQQKMTMFLDFFAFDKNLNGGHALVINDKEAFDRSAMLFGPPPSLN